MVHKNIKQLVLNYYESLLRFDMIINLFTECIFTQVNIKPIENELYTIEIDPIEKIYHENYDTIYYTGKIVQDIKTQNLYYIINKSNQITLKFLLSKDDIQQPLIPSYKEILKIDNKSYIPNITSSISTTYGRLLINIFLTIDPFKPLKKYLIPYINHPISTDDITNKYKALLLEKLIPPQIVNKYFTNLDYLQILTSIFVPSMSKKLLTPSPKAKQRLKELLKKYKNQLNNPDIMLNIEDEIIKIDKEYLKGDESEILLSSKSFNVHRKLMFYLYGMLENFGAEEGDPIYNFVLSNLDEGMQKKDLPLLFNECRRGFLKRGKESALGGTITKDIGRFLQSTEIVEDDCGTTRTLKYNVTPNNKDNIIYRYIIENGKLKLLTPNNIDNYIGKTVNLRSAMMCEAKDGLCFKCCDYIWELKKQKIVNVIPIAISSTIMMLSMKAMHGTKVSSYEIKEFNEFLY